MLSLVVQCFLKIAVGGVSGQANKQCEQSLRVFNLTDSADFSGFSNPDLSGGDFEQLIERRMNLTAYNSISRYSVEQIEGAWLHAFLFLFLPLAPYIFVVIMPRTPIKICAMPSQMHR